MPGYHPVSIYNITMGTKRQAGAWGTLSLVGCPVRLVLGDSMLDSSAVFLKKKKKKKKKNLPCSSLINGRPSSHSLGLRKKCQLIGSPLVATLYWRGSKLCLLGDGGSQ
jgi:hypothetical protein